MIQLLFSASLMRVTAGEITASPTDFNLTIYRARSSISNVCSKIIFINDYYHYYKQDNKQRYVENKRI